ncbi:uncharacterized protein LOC133992653 [Scomber scombrus]|uniref:uncharacterized protein LOC133992653 n=1 Tax=Scomber scombrus TaxID=13677 RepID=UPI002DD8E2FC|nr:uncharacterized protein LOC133992653 [Scomber scombrus]
MTHFRGQIRGPHWGPTMDNMLIDFWRKHECLFNSSLETYYDKRLKTKLWTEFAVSIGKPVADVERRARSLRTQYGRVLWHPEKVSTFQQKMLREKLDFLRPYIVRRRGELYLEDKFDDQEEEEDDDEEEELETEGSVDQEMGSTFGSPLDADSGGRDQDEELQFVTSPSNPPPQHSPNPQPQVTEVMSLSCDRHNHDEGSPLDQPDHTAAPNATSKYDILQQFAEVMLADMRQIKDPIVLMRLRRDITDLVFKAVEEDVQRRCVRSPSIPSLGQGAHFQSSSRPQQPPPYSQSSSWRQRFMRRKSKGSEMGRRTQRWEEVKHMRKTSRSQLLLLQPVQQSEALEGVNESIAQAMIQASEIKTETEPHAVKIDEESPPMV